MASRLGDPAMNPTAVFLADRGVVRVDGEDAPGFLQGLLTNDVVGLPEGEARYAALLTPQGKILFDFLVLRAPGASPAFLLDCPRSLCRARQAAVDLQVESQSGDL